MSGRARPRCEPAIQPGRVLGRPMWRRSSRWPESTSRAGCVSLWSASSGAHDALTPRRFHVSRNPGEHYRIRALPFRHPVDLLRGNIATIARSAVSRSNRRAFLSSAVALAATRLGVAAAEPVRTRLVLLGTGGGPRPRKASSASAQVIVTSNVAYVIDCGDGVARQLAYAGVPSPRCAISSSRTSTRITPPTTAI